jgi:uncharacterized protein YodC (DUF2158 family)
MFKTGDTVRVLEPFDEGFPQTYSVRDVITHDDGQVAVIIDDGTEDGSAFDPKYLEAAA